ncbi:hypothetical protein ABPG75_007882 [Micractinium tetrahymenae]
MDNWRPGSTPPPWSPRAAVAAAQPGNSATQPTQTWTPELFSDDALGVAAGGSGLPAAYSTDELQFWSDEPLWSATGAAFDYASPVAQLPLPAVHGSMHAYSRLYPAAPHVGYSYMIPVGSGQQVPMPAPALAAHAMAHLQPLLPAPSITGPDPWHMAAPGPAELQQQQQHHHHHHHHQQQQQQQQSQPPLPPPPPQPLLPQPPPSLPPPQQEEALAQEAHPEFEEPTAVGAASALPAGGGSLGHDAAAAVAYGQASSPAASAGVGAVAAAAAEAAAGASVDAASGRHAVETGRQADDGCPACGQPAVHYVAKRGRPKAEALDDLRNQWKLKFWKESEAAVGRDAAKAEKQAAAEDAERNFLIKHLVEQSISLRVSVMCSWEDTA